MKRWSSFGAVILMSIYALFILPIFLNALGRVWGILTIVTLIGSLWLSVEYHEWRWDKRFKGGAIVDGNAMSSCKSRK